MSKLKQLNGRLGRYYQNLKKRQHLRDDLKHKDRFSIELLERDIGLPKGYLQKELAKPFWVD